MENKEPSYQPDLTSPIGVEAYMRQSVNEADWDRRSDEVKKACGGELPRFWFGLITGGMFSNSDKGLLAEKQKEWKK